MLITNGSFRSHQTRKSNDQYSLVVVMWHLFQYYAMKVSIHINSQHLSQMVSQISRTYDFDRKFMEKRCGLSASLYGYFSRIPCGTNFCPQEKPICLKRKKVVPAKHKKSLICKNFVPHCISLWL